MVDRQKLRAQLLEHEQRRLFPYVDTVGKLTIGVGRNLTDTGISLEESDYLFDHDIDRAIRPLQATFPWFDGLSEVRQRVLVDMTFNLGLEGLLDFHKMLAALKSGRYSDAADEMLASRWAAQVGQRARTLAAMMRTGADGEVSA